MSLRRVDVGLAGKASKVLGEIRRDAAKNVVPADIISQLKRLPSLLQASGVPATMAFLHARAGKRKSSLEKAYAAICDALVTEIAEVWQWTDKPRDALEFFDRMHEQDSAAFSRASVRLREFAVWLRRLAEAIEHGQPAATPHAREGQDG